MNWSRGVPKSGSVDDFAFRKTTEQTKMLIFRSRRSRCVCGLPALVVLLLILSGGATSADEAKPDKDKTSPGEAEKVSYDKQIRPILQAHCQGCHQPAKAGGGYVMTSFDRMLKGGESGDRAIVPSQPGESHLSR